MTHITEVGNWHFEIAIVRGRRSKVGHPYTARVDLSIVDGQCHLEGAISTTPITHSDRKSIEIFIKQLGFSEYYSSSIENDVRTIKKTIIN